MLEKRKLGNGEWKSAWSTSTAPNGSASSTERYTFFVEFYEADFYGRGMKEYAFGYTRLEFKDGSFGPAFGMFDTGDAKHIERLKDLMKDGGTLSWN